MSHSNTKAIRADVPLGNTLIEGYLLPENLWTSTNKFGVSKTQAVILAHPQFERNYAASKYTETIKSKTAKTIAPQGFQVHRKIKTNAGKGDAANVDLLPVDQLPLFLKVCSKLGSQDATELLIDLAGLSLQQAFSDAFGLQFEKDERQDWLKKRQEGKQIRLDMTDAIDWYKEKHAKTLSDNAKHWMYKHCSDTLNIGIFGRTAKRLCVDLNVKDRGKLRDALTADELRSTTAHQPLGVWCGLE